MPTPSWWLFVRGPESIRVEVSEPLTVVVRGPGQRVVEHRFDTELALEDFALTLEKGLIQTGWEFAGFSTDRRVP